MNPSNVPRVPSIQLLDKMQLEIALLVLLGTTVVCLDYQQSRVNVRLDTSVPQVQRKSNRLEVTALLDNIVQLGLLSLLPVRLEHIRTNLDSHHALPVLLDSIAL